MYITFTAHTLALVLFTSTLWVVHLDLWVISGPFTTGLAKLKKTVSEWDIMLSTSSLRQEADNLR